MRKPEATAVPGSSFCIGVKSASEPTLIHIRGNAAWQPDRIARGARFFYVTCCSVAGNLRSNFDRTQLDRAFKWLVTAHPATIHKLLHSFLWISRNPLQLRARH